LWQRALEENHPPMLGREPLSPPARRRPAARILRGAMSDQLLVTCFRTWKLYYVSFISAWELTFVVGVYGEHSSSTAVHGMANMGYTRGLCASFCRGFVDQLARTNKRFQSNAGCLYDHVRLVYQSAYRPLPYHAARFIVVTVQFALIVVAGSIGCNDNWNVVPNEYVAIAGYPLG
jgi:hypothetical protein